MSLRVMVAEDLNKLRRQAATSQHYSDMLRYRDALKRSGAHQAVLDLSLPHIWKIAGGDMTQSDALTLLEFNTRDDHGLHPFFGSHARPLTFKETVEARLEQLEKPEIYGVDLWKIHLDTCTAVAWEAHGKRFKIVQLYPPFTQPFSSTSVEYLPINFDDFPGTPIETDDTFNVPLTMAEAICHRGWLALLEGDSALLQRYATAVFGQMTRLQRGMGFPTPRDDWPAHVQPRQLPIPDVSYFDMPKPIWAWYQFAYMAPLNF